MGLRNLFNIFSSNDKNSSSNSAEKDLSVKKISADLKKEILLQDKQISEINAAEQEYLQTGDIDSLICFWENIWNNGGLLFRGSSKTFRLPDLYIKAKRYDDALRILKRIRKAGEYNEKADSYIEKVNKAISKQKK